ncbi:MAG: leucine-rich repeat protein [Prevotella sp.]|nr:leucine-rich repeat protein [Prevotella sp.]MBQ9223199.1 leucine-rich repeat protein [Prevotella sp.]
MALTSLVCENDQLITLDVSKNTALKYLYCSKNQLTSLDVSENTALIELGFHGNKLNSIDVSKNIALEMLECSDNQLASLDVSKNTALINLGCMNNQLTTLDMSNNTALTYVQCQYNQLTTLDVSKNTALTNLHCESNQIKDDAMDALINSLPTVESGTFVVVNKQSRANEGNICTKEQVATAKAKGWKVMAHTDAGYAEYAGSDTQEVDPTKVIEATCKQVIDGPDGAIYRVTGVCKEIVNSTYGNWYLEDETGTIYIYGTVDSNGQYPRYTSWESFGINVGETITVQGPKTTYKDTPELVNVQVLRPLTLLSGDRININCEERVDTIRLYCEGDSYEVEIPADATWVTIKEQTTGKDPIIVLHIDENKGVSRWTAVKISSTINGQKYEKSVSISQDNYYFTAKTVEGVELTYCVVSESPTKTCSVFGGIKDNVNISYYPALDTLTVGHVTIPAEVNGYSVVGINFDAFMNCKNITGVTMPDCITTIYSEAFKGCTSLKDIQFSSSLNSLGSEIFEGTVWFANQPDGPVYINDSLLYVYKGEMPADTHFEVKEGCTYIGYAAFMGQSNLTSITLPETVKTIDGFAFSQTGLKEVTIPASCKMVQQRSFYRCSELESVIILGQPEMRNTIFSLCPNLKSVKCYSDKPWDNVYTSCFYYRYEDRDDNSVYQRVTLSVPHGSKEAYQAVAPWSEFQNIVEMDLAPIDNGTNVNIGTEINSDTNLDGNVVGNILYNISSGNGEYDSENGCIVVSKPVSDETMNNLVGKDIFGEDFKDQYTGIVFKVAEGKGNVKVEAQTTGNMVLKVKIGNSDPIEMELDGKLKITFPYNVSEETLVYIYGSTKAAQAKRKMKGVTNTESGSLKIFGIEITSEGTGIQDNLMDDGPQDVYSLSGQKVRSQAKDLKGLPAGVYIVGGKKIFVK